MKINGRHLKSKSGYSYIKCNETDIEIIKIQKFCDKVLKSSQKENVKNRSYLSK